MKFTYFQLESSLAKTLLPIYIVSGEEILLKQDAIHLIRQAAQRAGFGERIRLKIEKAEDAEEVYALLHSSSLMGEKQLIELDLRDITPNKTLCQILEEYGRSPSAAHLLLIDLGKGETKITKSAWYQALEKAGAVVPLWPIPREQLPSWIVQRAKKYKIILQAEAAALLADYVEGNLAAAAQMIEKILLLKPQKPVDKHFIQAILNDEGRFTIFDFVDHLLLGQAARSLHILSHLKAEGTEPALLLWGITRELRLLAELAQELAKGAALERLFQTHHIFFRRQTSIRRFLAAHTAQDCWHYLASAAEIDQLIKGARIGNVWHSLQLFCMRLMGGRG